MRILIFVIIIFWNCQFSFANHDYYAITPAHKEAYELIIALRFDEGKAIIDQIKKKNPSDLLVYHIENYIDFLTIFISENKEEFISRQPNKEYRLEKLKQGDPNDPYFLFSQAEIHLQWALTRLKFEEYLTAAMEVNKAIGMLEKNQKRFPDFISNKKSLSILHAIVGTIPETYRGFLSVISNFEGTIDQGNKEIDEVLMYAEKKDYFFEKEAIAIKSLLLLHLMNDQNGAWNYLNKSKLDPYNNPLLTFLFASIAMKSGKNDAAIQLLEKRERSLKFFPMFYLDHMLGSAKLYRQDKDANVYLNSYLHNFSGQNYIKDSYRKLAWYELTINQNIEGYRAMMDLCLNHGYESIEEDKSAQKEAKLQKVPQFELLKSRLLYDGGYGMKAMKSINSIKLETLDDSNKIEFYYRLGRIMQLTDKSPEAMQAFEKCINIGESSSMYYACNAALQLGLISEQSGQIEQSALYFNQCLNMKPSEYKNSLHQKAKSGLSRIRKK